MCGPVPPVAILPRHNPGNLTFIFYSATIPRQRVGLGLGLGLYTEGITRWREDMNFMFEWQERYERSEQRYCSCHENIKFVSLN